MLPPESNRKCLGEGCIQGHVFPEQEGTKGGIEVTIIIYAYLSPKITGDYLVGLEPNSITVTPVLWEWICGRGQILPCGFTLGPTLGKVGRLRVNDREAQRCRVSEIERGERLRQREIMTETLT